MTRFARAKGSKSSNERTPENATSWNVMKQQLLEKHKDIANSKNRKQMEAQRTANYNAFLAERQENELKQTKWADFPEENSAKGKNRKQNGTNTEYSSSDDEMFSALKMKVDAVLDERAGAKGSDSDEAPEETSAKVAVPEVKVKKVKQQKKLLKIVVDKQQKVNEDGAEETKTVLPKVNKKKQKRLEKSSKIAEKLEKEPERPVLPKKKKAKQQKSNEEETKDRNSNLVPISEMSEKQLLQHQKKLQRRLRQREKRKEMREKIKSQKEAGPHVELSEKDLERIEKRKQKRLKHIEKKKKLREEELSLEKPQKPEVASKEKAERKNLSEEELKKIEKKKQKEMKQAEKRRKAKEEKLAMEQQQETEAESTEPTFSYPQKPLRGPPKPVVQKQGKPRDNNQHDRRKPLQPNKMIINGKEVDVDYVDGFPVKKEDADRLKKLRREMISKGLPRSEINISLKLERRKAEKAFTRERKKVCFNCRKSCHVLSECPELDKNQITQDAGTGICFKCGSTEHTHFECKVVRGQEFKFAQCFVCNEQGHIARQCPDNARGLYPKGGACNVCGDVTHLKKDCPKFQAQQQHLQSGLEVQTWGEGNPDEMGEKFGSQAKTKSRPNKIVKF